MIQFSLSLETPVSGNIPICRTRKIQKLGLDLNVHGGANQNLAMHGGGALDLFSKIKYINI